MGLWVASMQALPPAKQCRQGSRHSRHPPACSVVPVCAEPIRQKLSHVGNRLVERLLLCKSRPAFSRLGFAGFAYVTSDRCTKPCVFAAAAAVVCATGGQGRRRDITIEEVQQHNTMEDAWMVLHGKVRCIS
jgi:hypothetical protein